ncbi:seryl-tRNA synthetase [Paenibacillus cellulosilyticus]|uniref:Serine--tRNA ligase n=1 Tax=Paenibacillus cellulosilyticus TaxID=375489 RepID=A0A2V2YMY8_9BACL|nr:serine--tRNA ligase [Paenibacillus cellulosilyticus]PWV95691.1 seryl-tRNA synthetase [Paenibacillus cellulosilyticus]QKS47673.1 serine--tRNA ligase [Paenibacillus cellulosilyticus]
MLDIKWIRVHADEVQQAADDKRINLQVSELLALDDERKRLIQETDRLREARNAASRHIGQLMQNGDPAAADAVRQETAAMLAELDALQPKLAELERQWSQQMLLVPNIVSPATPRGASDADNVLVRQVGELPAFDFTPRSHVELGELHGLMDLARGVKTAGTRQYYLRGAGVLLHRAVQQLALDVLLERGFTPLDVPLAVREEAMVNTGFFPLGTDQTYRIAGEDRLLVGTSEVPLISYLSDEIVDVTEPIRLAAASLCFRSEVGSAGRDVHGLYRVHQFAKVEQVVLCEADPAVSERILHEITSHAEHILNLLELPYRVMAVCTGDMSQKTYQQFDIETWMPSRDAYGETHSSSNVHDFQARRSNIRYRGADGKLHFCHTLNNTAVASPRILIPLLENHQEADGSIRIPTALQPYLGGLKRLELPASPAVTSREQTTLAREE